MAWVALLASVLAAVGTVYQLATAWIGGRAFVPLDEVDTAALTIFKPLYGDEPRLLANLKSFVTQDYPGPVQIVLGVHDAADAAVVAVEALKLARPEADIVLVADPRRHGTNAKVSNLINMMTAARHDVLVLSDSDMAATPDYLQQVVATLDQPGVGVATCFYTGRGDAGFWSRIAAMGISHGYLPSGLFAARTGIARPCMGSTIALRRETLERIGGFEAVADMLADDYAIGEAVTKLGLKVAIAPLLLAHGCTETSLGALVRHELRWNLTVYRLAPGGFAGLGLMNPLPIALVTALCGGSAWLILAALAARLIVALRIDRLTRASPGPLWLLPLRDLLTFGLFLATFFRHSVDWRGARLDITQGGDIRRS